MPTCISNAIGLPFKKDNKQIFDPTKIPFESFIRNAVIQNTELDNWNLVGKTKFLIVVHDTANFRIRLDRAVPELVKTGIEAYNQGKKWMLMKDYGSVCLIDSITHDGTYEWVNYNHYGIISSISGPYVAGNSVMFFNPFMNYKFASNSPVVNIGVAGTWNSLYAVPQGMWQAENGMYKLVIMGINTQGGQVKLGLAESADLQTWSYTNNGQPLYTGGTGIFLIPGVCDVGKNVTCIGNPIKLGPNNYLQFFTMVNAANISAIGWAKHDDDFVITQVCSSYIDFTSIGFPADYITHYATGVMWNNQLHLFFVDRGSATNSTWKCVRAIIDDIDTMQVVGGGVVIANTGGETWNSRHMDGCIPFIWNNKIYLLVSGTGVDTATNNLYGSNRETGLLIQQDNGTFAVDTRSPVYLNPINGNYLWNVPGPDHMGTGISTWFKDNEFHLFVTMNSSTNTYQVYHIITPMDKIP